MVGLTGGIGSGKSTVAQIFSALGVATIDADAIARALTAPGGGAMASIRTAFGDDVIGSDGALDRAEMRARAFADNGLKAKLEAILHPLIRTQTQHQIAMAAANGAPYIVLEIPLLFEAMTYRNTLARTLTIDCPIHAQVERVRQRSKLPDAEINAIIAAQIPRAIRLQLTDDLIENVGNRDDLTASVAALHSRYKLMALC